MFRPLAILMSIISMSFVLCACQAKPTEKEDTESSLPTDVESSMPTDAGSSMPTDVESSMPTDAETEISLEQELRGLWARIDGSTATIPLSEGLYKYFNENMADTEIKHNKTHEAYENLFAGNCDLIFVTYPSEEELAYMKSTGENYEIIPVVKDAFVFLLNAENAVDNLTVTQLQDIYCGDITEWPQVDGASGPIFPFQRPENSGSQTLFLKLLMKDRRPMKPPLDMVPGGMDDLIDVIGEYNNSKYAIGYSVFYYASSMYGNDKVKLLGVDGVIPSKETIAKGEYPLETYYYAVIKKNTPADHPARKLLNFLLTEQGQTVAVQAGYVPLYPLAMNSTSGEERQSTTVSSGTGGKAHIGGLPPENIGLSDLFYDGVNYVAYINDELSRIFAPIQDNSDEPEIYYVAGLYGYNFYVKRPFTGVPFDYRGFKVDKWGYFYVTFDQNNPFFVLNERDSIFRIEIGIPESMTPYDLQSSGINYGSIGILQVPKTTQTGIEYDLPILYPYEPENENDLAVSLFFSSNLNGKTPDELKVIDTHITEQWVTSAIRFMNGETASIRIDVANRKIIGAEELFYSRFKSAIAFWENCSPEMAELFGEPFDGTKDPFEYAFRGDYWREEEASKATNPKDGYKIINVWDEPYFMVVETQDPDGTKGLYRFNFNFSQVMAGGY